MVAAFRITAFGGILPKVSPRLIGDTMAQRAANLKIASGELVPLGASSLVHVPGKPLPPLSMFLARNGSASAWFTWPIDVDVVRAPLSADVESRFYWTGDGEPRYATYSKATQSGLSDYPSHYWSLGVPAPATAPTVTPTGGVSATLVDRLYRYTFFSALGEESAPSPASAMTNGKVDASWGISGMDAMPPNSGDITALTYVGTTVTITTSNPHYNRVGEQITVAGVTTVANANGTWALTAVNAAAKTMTFTVATAPTGAYNNATDTTDTWARAVDWNTTGMKRRLYRSAGTNATYQLVHDDVGTSYSDILSDSAIMGDELISDGWALPPVGLSGLITHPSGALIGFIGNQLCMSEPSQPHAWPAGYRLSTDYGIIGIAVYGSEVMAATSGSPYIASGTEPASMSLTGAGVSYPCLSKRSVISVGDGALYATKHGLVFVGSGGVRMFTQNHYTEDEWGLLNPASMFSELSNGRVYVGYTDTSGSQGVLIFDGDTETTADVACGSMYTEEASGDLHIGDATGVRLWDNNDANPVGLTWRSKEFTVPRPVNMGAAKVEYDQVMSDADIAALVAAYAAAAATNAALIAAGDVGGEVGGETLGDVTLGCSSLVAMPLDAPSNWVSFTLYIGARVLFSRAITNTKAFRLPPGIKYDRFSVEVATQNKVRAILIGETMKSLGQV